MKLELRENMYIRNCYGRIAKIEYIEDNKASLPMGRDEFTYEMRYSDPVVLANSFRKRINGKCSKMF